MYMAGEGYAFTHGCRVSQLSNGPSSDPAHSMDPKRILTFLPTPHWPHHIFMHKHRLITIRFSSNIFLLPSFISFI
jgi:hypothetical protein